MLHNSLLQSSIGYNVFLCNSRIIISPEKLPALKILLFYNDSPKTRPHMMQLRSQAIRYVPWNRKLVHWLVLLADAAAEQAQISGSVQFAVPISEPWQTVCASMCMWGFTYLTKYPELWLQLKVNCQCPLIGNVAPCFVWSGFHCPRGTELLNK